ncbi:hypothetical protein JTB14_027485 [Gonioctena quinquepunctata]|nr:hypothetical protein JTB14_027485 [Gonioctena quinquepunctata]
MKIESITSPKLQTDGDQSKSELEDSKGFSVDENTQLKPNLFNDGIIVKNEDCTDDLSIQITEWETETIKTEDNIDIVHEDDKPELFDESLIKIESSTSPELPTDNGGVQHDDAFKEVYEKVQDKFLSLIQLKEENAEKMYQKPV